MNKTISLISPWGIESSLYYDMTAFRDELARPYIGLREEIERAGYNFEVTPDGSHTEHSAALVSLCNLDQKIVDSLLRKKPEQCFLVLTEPPVVTPHMYNPLLKKLFGTIFTMFDDQLDGKTYCKFHHPQARAKICEDLVGFGSKKLCVMVQGNKRSSHPSELYSKRREIAAFFPNDGQFDLYGGSWEGYPCWRGPFQGDKIALWKNYKFAICYENMHRQRGYITERIFEALYARCVPVYWGAENIADYIPKQCYLERRDFVSNEALYAHMLQMSEAEHGRYLQAARDYLHSPASERDFSPQSFGKQLMETIRERIHS